jgi:hypothetical protein
MAVKEAVVEILVLVVTLVVLDLAAQRFGVDSRPADAERVRS